MKFSIIHPTRSRPEKSRATLNKWLERCGAEHLQVIISVDLNDPLLDEYYPHGYHYSAQRKTQDITKLVGANRSAIDAINNAAKVATGDIFIVVSDDTDCPENWDKIISSVVEGKEDFVVKFHDGIQKRIITMPCLDRKYYERDGWIYNPVFKHAFADTTFTEMAHIRGRVITRLDIMFEHLHPERVGGERDALQLRNDATHDEGRKIFQDLQRINFGL